MTQAKLQRITVSYDGLAPLGARTKTLEALYHPNGTPMALNIHSDVTFPNYLTWKNNTLWQHTSTIQEPAGDLRSALLNLRRSATAANVASMQIGETAVHTQAPGSIFSEIALLSGRSGSGHLTQARQTVLEVVDAARLVQRFVK